MLILLKMAHNILPSTVDPQVISKLTGSRLSAVVCSFNSVLSSLSVEDCRLRQVVSSLNVEDCRFKMVGKFKFQLRPRDVQLVSQRPPKVPLI